MFKTHPAGPAAALPDALADALHHSPVRVPRVHGLTESEVVRWLYRAWTLDHGWVPLVQLPSTVGPLTSRAAPVGPALQEAIALAQGGWLHLSEDTLPGIVPDGVRLLVPGGGPTLDLPVELVEQARALDALFLVATDPALEAARRGLMAFTHTGATVLLHGPTGSGRRSLARLAWLVDGGGAPYQEASASLAAPHSWVVVDAEPEELERVAGRGLAPRRGPGTAGAGAVHPNHPAFSGIHGESPAMARLLSDAARVARSAASVLLLGEPGVGKEALARAIHQASGRSGPFEALDLGAIPVELLESELFGHVRGAFTGAATDRPGAFRRAQGGTLLLDEIGNLDLSAQARLLRVLQERAIRPVGGERTIPVDVRVVAATNADLDALVRRGAFRMDLLHRINAITLRLPPLRERGADVTLLAGRFLAEARGRETAELRADAARMLQDWSWPGNVRELWGLMQRAAAFSGPDEALAPEHLEPLAGAGRLGPTVLISSEDSPPGLPGGVLRLPVPGLAQRGAQSLRHALLHLSGGRLIRLDALHALEQVDWTGGLGAMRATMEALLAGTTGPVDRAALERALPHLSRVGGEPMVVVIAPSPEAEGFERPFPERAVLIGRARGFADLNAGDARGAARVAAVRALCQGVDPAFLCFPTEASLSRAHALLTRAAGGLVLQVLPGAAAPTTVVGVDGRRRPCPVGAPVALGEAAELRVALDRAGARELVLQLYENGAARTRHAGAFALSDSVQEAARAETARGLEQAPPSSAGGRVWALTAPERAAVNEVVLAWSGGDMTAHLRAGLLEAAEDPAVARVAAWILRVRPTQYLARLYDFGGNHPLVDELLARLEGKPEAEVWLASLPNQLSAVLLPRWLARGGA